MVVATAAGAAAAAGELLLYGAIGIALARYLEHRRRRFLMTFDLDGADAARFQRLAAALAELATSGSFRGVTQVGHHADWKRNGGATRALSFDTAALRQAVPPHIVTNVTPWMLATQGLQLYFFPDRVLIRRRGELAALSYTQLESSQARCVWDEALPYDARVVGETWKFVRRDGGPDGRFNNNRQIPVVMTASLTLRSSTGLDIAVQSAKIEAAGRLAAECRTYRSTVMLQATRLPQHDLAAPLATALAALGLDALPTAASLEQIYRELGTRNHPDRFARASRELQAFAGQRGAELAAAYEVVRAQLGGDPSASGGRALVPLAPVVPSSRWVRAERLASIAAAGLALSLFVALRASSRAPSSVSTAHAVQPVVAAAARPATPTLPAPLPVRRVVIACPLRFEPSPTSRVLAGIAAGAALTILDGARAGCACGLPTAAKAGPGRSAGSRPPGPRAARRPS
ncbi:MAG TPA: hypothetical protein VGC42_21590 [Kofleriaceae bacterium]